MGSHPSKRIQSADISRRQRDTAPQRSLSLSNTTTSTKVKHFQPENDKNDRTRTKKVESSKSVSELENESIATKKLMTEIECQNLELQDYIQTLEQQLEFVQQENDKQPRSDTCSETVQVKEQQIEKLQKEIDILQSDMSELRLKCKKKVRIMKRKSALAKNEGSMDNVELKEEMVKLEEENQRLKKKLSKMSVSRDQDIEEVTESGEDDKAAGKMKIILDLSAQVSEQDALITELGNKLNERDKYVKQLEKQLRESGIHKPTEREVHHSEQEPSTKTATTREENSRFGTKTNFGGLLSDNANSTSEQAEDINWYTNQTFEQFSKTGKRGSADAFNGGSIRGIRTNKEEEHQSLKDKEEKDEFDEDGRSELNAIAEEFKKLQRGGKKKKTNKTVNKVKVSGADLTQDHFSSRPSRGEEGHSNCNGIFLTQTLDHSDESDFCTKTEDLRGCSDSTIEREGGGYKSEQVDKSGLRRKPKTTKQRRADHRDHMLADDNGGSFRHAAGVLNVNSGDAGLSEASMLLDSIDEDMRHLTNGTRQRMAVVST